MCTLSNARCGIRACCAPSARPKARTSAPPVGSWPRQRARTRPHHRRAHTLSLSLSNSQREMLPCRRLNLRTLYVIVHVLRYKCICLVPQVEVPRYCSHNRPDTAHSPAPWRLPLCTHWTSLSRRRPRVESPLSIYSHRHRESARPPGPAGSRSIVSRLPQCALPLPQPGRPGPRPSCARLAACGVGRRVRRAAVPRPLPH